MCLLSTTGVLPIAWAGNGALPSLNELYLSNNRIFSELPKEWSRDGAFKSLAKLDMSRNALYGKLPEDWGLNNQSFRSLTELMLAFNNLSGMSYVGQMPIPAPPCNRRRWPAQAVG